VSRYAAFLGLLTGFDVAWGAFLAFSLAENSQGNRIWNWLKLWVLGKGLGY
jgi:hypothetical protein